MFPSIRPGLAQAPSNQSAGSDVISTDERPLTPSSTFSRRRDGAREARSVAQSEHRWEGQASVEEDEKQKKRRNITTRSLEPLITNQ